MVKRLVVSDREMEAVHRMESNIRHSYFVKRVVDWEAAWGLSHKEWAIVRDDAGIAALPLWPAREYAGACAVGAWAAYQPEEIPLEELTSELLVRLQVDGLQVAVFPTPSDAGALVQAYALSESLRAEIEEWY